MGDPKQQQPEPQPEQEDIILIEIRAVNELCINEEETDNEYDYELDDDIYD